MQQKRTVGAGTEHIRRGERLWHFPNYINLVGAQSSKAKEQGKFSTIYRYVANGCPKDPYAYARHAPNAPSIALSCSRSAGYALHLLSTYLGV